ncbi:MAG: DUF655 domain-containing protein [Candidatus Altiarchaeota archaeon]|nr:DUF655 domain-containing protein [Candidatus Altiarchaeota archaeon]
MQVICLDNVKILDILKSGTPFSVKPEVDRELRSRGVVLSRGGYLTIDIGFGITLEKLFPVLLVPLIAIKNGEDIDLRDKEKVKAWARIPMNDLPSVAAGAVTDFIDNLVETEEKRFVDFFNKAPAITTRLHSLELLPGIGKKHMWEIIEKRRKPFESFEDIKDRIPLIPNPKKSIKERIIRELREEDKYYIFILPPRDKWRR